MTYSTFKLTSIVKSTVFLGRGCYRLLRTATAVGRLLDLASSTLFYAYFSTIATDKLYT